MSIVGRLVSVFLAFLVFAVWSDRADAGNCLTQRSLRERNCVRGLPPPVENVCSTPRLPQL